MSCVLMFFRYLLEKMPKLSGCRWIGPNGGLPTLELHQLCHQRIHPISVGSLFLLEGSEELEVERFVFQCSQYLVVLVRHALRDQEDASAKLLKGCDSLIHVQVAYSKPEFPNQGCSFQEHFQGSELFLSRCRGVGGDDFWEGCCCWAR